jgi:hypothetical protein
MDNWMKYSLAVGILCIICPPLLGIVAGMAVFCAMWYGVYKIIEG